MQKSKPLLILIDGYSGAGKSTALQIFKQILGENFKLIPKYTTRLARQHTFDESKSLNEDKFKSKKLDYVYKREGNIFYGLSKREIENALQKKGVSFIVVNPIHRKFVTSEFENKVDIINLYIKTDKQIRVKRIEEDKIMDENSKEQRLFVLRTSTPRNEEDFQAVIVNNGTLDEFHENILEFCKEILQ